MGKRENYNKLFNSTRNYSYSAVASFYSRRSKNEKIQRRHCSAKQSLYKDSSYSCFIVFFIYIHHRASSLRAIWTNVLVCRYIHMRWKIVLTLTWQSVCLLIESVLHRWRQIYKLEWLTIRPLCTGNRNDHARKTGAVYFGHWFRKQMVKTNDYRLRMISINCE